MTRCKLCNRPALYRTKNNSRLRGNKDHALCQRCWRDARNAALADEEKRRTSEGSQRVHD
jgi:hypothetical protein